MSSADIALQMMADDEGQLLERLARAEADLDTYRALAQQAIHVLHDMTQERDRMQEQHYRLLDEYRTLRAKIMHQAVAA